MAGTKISELTELTTPTGEEELVYAKDGQNGKIKVSNLVNYAQSIIGANIAGYSSNSIGGTYRERNTTDYLLFTAPVTATYFFMYTWSQNRTASFKFVTGTGKEYTPPQSTSGNNFYTITVDAGDTISARIFVQGNSNYSAMGQITSYVIFGPSS